MLSKSYRTRLGTWKEAGFKKLICPKCGKATFVPLVDYETGEIIDATIYGRCERINSCGYNRIKTGSGTVLGSYKYKNNYEFTTTAKKVSRSEKPSLINSDIKFSSLDGWTTNNLVYAIWKNTGVHYDKICDKIYEYHIGTSTHRYYKDAPIFWQTDVKGEVRSGKIIQYDKETGKRIRTLTPPVKWMHTVLNLRDFEIKQCLFGEHLISMNISMPIAIVESEKSAFIMSLFWKDFIWLATGGIENLNDRANRILMGRDVTIFPDVDNAEEKWYAKALKYDWKYQSVRKLMDAEGYNYKEGDDIADLTLWKKRKLH